MFLVTPKNEKQQAIRQYFAAFRGAAGWVGWRDRIADRLQGVRGYDNEGDLRCINELRAAEQYVQT